MSRSECRSQLSYTIVLHKSIPLILKPNETVQLEKQLTEQAAAMGNTVKTATQEAAKENVTTSDIKQIEINKLNSITSEQIIKDKLTSQLGVNEEILTKPRIYIGDGSSGKYAVPDFAIYNTESGEIIRIIDAKNGGHCQQKLSYS
jgi:hypothetical protein